MQNVNQFGRTRYPKPPPRYYDEDNKRAVEVCVPSYDSIFEPAERQRHFGILRYTVNNRFKKIMLIVGILVVLMVLLIIGVVLLIVFTAAKGSSPLGCLPTTRTTYLFAYSNDFDPQIVLNTWIDRSSNEVYSHFANIRFDLRKSEDIQYHTDLQTANASIHTHLPDPSLGFPSSDFSSDILNILRDFLSNTVAPICGSRIQILLKRYPNENYTSTLIETFQSNHVSVNVITSNTPSGGLFHQTMYEIATRTNGVCAFEDEAYFNKTSYFLNQLENPYILYSVNVPVSGNGSVVLPPLTVKYPTYYCPLWVALTVQDHGK
uniref:Helitron_like_N domain-containing protein n=1 Tax=Caenorhabditis tropicalis TaxID=1561998 RepID=A0A1I7TTN7_9PELO